MENILDLSHKERDQTGDDKNVDFIGNETKEHNNQQRIEEYPDVTTGISHDGESTFTCKSCDKSCDRYLEFIRIHTI